MYKLYFLPSRGRDRVLGTAWSQQACEAMIPTFLKEHGFTSYYTRRWETPYKGKKATKYDVGSHTEFFVITNDKQ